MNYQTFSNLEIRPLLKNSFENLHVELKDASGEKIVVICRYYSTCFDV